MMNHVEFAKAVNKLYGRNKLFTIAGSVAFHNDVYVHRRLMHQRIVIDNHTIVKPVCTPDLRNEDLELCSLLANYATMHIDHGNYIMLYDIIQNFYYNNHAPTTLRRL